VDIAQKYVQQSSHPLILALTASPSAENVKEICENLAIKNIEIRSETDADVSPYVHKREYERVFVEFPPEFEEVRSYLQSFYDDCFAKLKEMKFIYTDYLKKADLVKLQNHVINGRLFAALPYTTGMLKVSHAMEILETQGIFALYSYFEKLKSENKRTSKQIMKDERILNAIRKTEKLYVDGKGHPKLDKLKEIVAREFSANPSAKAIVFSHYRESAQVITNVLQEYKSVRFVGQAKKGHDIGLNQARQAKILQDFRDGKHRILVATSVGEEGLDIPSVDMVIFYEPVASEIRKIQREGRTGRKKAGKVIILITKKTRDETYYWMGHYKERKMKKILEEMKNDLNEESRQTKLM
jgi:Fanconi anemia group M protein